MEKRVNHISNLWICKIQGGYKNGEQEEKDIYY